MIPFADDRAKKKYGITPLCASEKEKYISGAADFGQQCGAVIPDRKRWKVYTNDIGHLLLFFIVNLWGEGSFSRDFATNLAPQCRAWSTSGLPRKL